MTPQTVAAQEAEKRMVEINDINTKMKIAKRIVEACEEEVKGLKVKQANINDRMHFYTKAEPYLIYKTRSHEQPERKFWMWLCDQDLDSKVKNVTYDDIREEIFDSYISKRTIPTIKSLLKNIARKLNGPRQMRVEYNDIVHYLKNAGFTWMRLPGTDKSVIIEKPEQAFKRHRYLQQIMKYREDGRCFVYVDERNFTKTGMMYEYYTLNLNAHYFFIAATTSGFSYNNIIFKTNCNEDRLNRCILESVVPYIPQSSVIVLSEKNNHIKLRVVPNENSSKSVMSEWLTNNNIPHEPNAHRAELFTLIQKCKNKTAKQSYKLDEILKAHGHDVVYRPHGMKMLNYFTKFLDDEKVKLLTQDDKHLNPSTLKFGLISIKNSYTNEDWRKLEDDLITIENKIYEEDMQMEVIIDQLMTMATYGGIPESDLPSDLDSVMPDEHHLFKSIAF